MFSKKTSLRFVSAILVIVLTFAAISTLNITAVDKTITPKRDYVNFRSPVDSTENSDSGIKELKEYFPAQENYIEKAFKYEKTQDITEFIADLDALSSVKILANGVKGVLMDNIGKNFYKPSRQPEAYDIRYGFADYRTMDSDALISKIYEPLREAHPDNITRENIGKDDSGKYDMWCYIFEPENYEYTVFIAAGSHGMNEAQSYLGLARLMQLVWNDIKRNNNEHLNLLREKVRFIVIPLVNVWDVSERVHGAEVTYSPYNSNNVNINRNWLTDTPEDEVANIKKILNRYKDEIDFGFDFHTDPEGFPGWGSYLLVYPAGVYDFFSDTLKEVCDYLDYKNFVSKGIYIKKAFRGDALNYPQGSRWDVTKEPDYPRSQNISTCASVLWSEFGIPSATIEHGSRKFGDRVFCGSQDMTAAVELYANQILQQIYNNLKERVAKVKDSAN